jgi:HEAT repeats
MIDDVNASCRRLLTWFVVGLFAVSCSTQSSEQARRERAKQKAIIEFDRQQIDEQPANWSEPRLLAALASPDVSDRANAARELGWRKTVNARQPLRDLMLHDSNSVVVTESELALIRIGHPDDIAAIRDYASPRVESLDGTFIHNLSLLDDAWVEDLLKEAWEKARDNSRRGL